MADLRRRMLVPELLDDLPPGDPAAIRSRADLARVNAVMLQARIMARLLREGVAEAPRRILEIGAGDGRFALSLASRLHRVWPGVEIVLLDRLDMETPSRIEAFADFGWRARYVRRDAFEFASDERFDAVYANLFLHHFDDEALARLLQVYAFVAPVFAACEPRRTAFAFRASRLLWVLGANHVTRHDAPASVRAGFHGLELSELWPDDARSIVERPALPFTHAFLVCPQREVAT